MSDKMREAFEEAWLSEFPQANMARAYSGEGYEENEVDAGWDGYRMALAQQPESEPIAYISKIALEELQKPECSEDMFGVTGTPSGCWDVGLFLDPPPTVRVPEALTCEMVSAGVAALEKSYAHEEAWSDTVRSVFKAMRSAASSIAEKEEDSE